MNDRRFLKPAEGKPPIPSPDHPVTGYLPVTGDWVTFSIYWGRRLSDEDVTDDTAAQLKAEKPAKKES